MSNSANSPLKTIETNKNFNQNTKLILTSPTNLNNLTSSSKVVIKEVWSYNLEEEIAKISKLIEKYPYVAMDTEFPGTIHSVNKLKEANYQKIRLNVDDLKLIQCGISISDEKGNIPADCSTWQFNLKFDRNKDKSNPDSIALLINSGIEFDKLNEEGIEPNHFGEVLITSGLILTDEIKWISFHGGYDFAYLLKILTNDLLPQSESSFLDSLKIYFPILYDIRHLTRNIDRLSKSLQKLAQDLDVSRIGSQHQAGSDSLITLRVFHKLVNHYLTNESLKADECILFDLGVFYEDESAAVFGGMIYNGLTSSYENNSTGINYNNNTSNNAHSNNYLYNNNYGNNAGISGNNNINNNNIGGLSLVDSNPYYPGNNNYVYSYYNNITGINNGNSSYNNDYIYGLGNNNSGIYGFSESKNETSSNK